MFVKKCLYMFLQKANQTAVPYSKRISKTKKVDYITQQHWMVNGQNTFLGGCSVTCYEGHSGHVAGTVCLLSPWWRSNIQFVCTHIAGKKNTQLGIFRIKVYRLGLPLHFIPFSHCAVLALIPPFLQLYSIVAPFFKGQFNEVCLFLYCLSFLLYIVLPLMCYVKHFEPPC